MAGAVEMHDTFIVLIYGAAEVAGSNLNDLSVADGLLVPDGC